MLKLPKEFATRIRSLGDLPFEQRKKLLTTLGEMNCGFDFEEKVRDSIISAGVDRELVVDTARAIIGLHYLYASSPENNLQEFSVELLKALTEAISDSGSTSTLSNEVLNEYLNAASLRTSAKASTLLFDVERAFMSAKIITDIRPVFGENISEIPAAFLIHFLRVSYRGDDDEDFFVGLSTKDLKDLSKVIDRALLKAEALQKVMPKLTKEPIDPA